MYRLATVKKSSGVVMESLAYENATPLNVDPPPLRGDVWILGHRYSLPRGRVTSCTFLLATTSYGGLPDAQQ